MSEIDFRPYIKAYLNIPEKKVTLCRPFTDNNIGKVFELTDVGITVFQNIGKGLTAEQIIIAVVIQFPDSSQEVADILDLLFTEKYIETTQSVDSEYSEIEKQYGRLLPLWAEFEDEQLNRFQIQQYLMQKKIGIIGCGTIGLGIISKLTVFGITDYVLIDPDVVEETNLSRQTLFSLDDIGTSKVDCAKKFITSRKRNANVITVQSAITTITDIEVLKSVDLVVVAGDYPSYKELAYLVQKFCFSYNIPISFAGGYRAHIGKIYPLVIPGKTACFDCLNQHFNAEPDSLGERLGNKNNKVSSTVQMGDFITSIVSFEIIKHLSGVMPTYLVNKFLLMDFSFYNLTELPFDQKANCPYCYS